MTKVRTTLLDIPELENLDLKTETRDGKRHYIDSEGNAYLPEWAFNGIGDMYSLSLIHI